MIDLMNDDTTSTPCSMKSLSQALRIAVAMLRMPPILLKHENLIRCVVAVATVQKQNGEDRDRRLVLPSFNQPI